MSATIICAWCAVYFGHADWSRSHTAACFDIDQNHIILLLHDQNHCDVPRREELELRKLIGRKLIVCIGQGVGREVSWASRCFIKGPNGLSIDVAQEMHKRGF
jgi:hypothetical protein